MRQSSKFGIDDAETAGTVGSSHKQRIGDTSGCQRDDLKRSLVHAPTRQSSIQPTPCRATAYWVS
jgi:hypothetical protein